MLVAWHDHLRTYLLPQTHSARLRRATPTKATTRQRCVEIIHGSSLQGTGYWHIVLRTAPHLAQSAQLHAPCRASMPASSCTCRRRRCCGCRQASLVATMRRRPSHARLRPFFATAERWLLVRYLAHAFPPRLPSDLAASSFPSSAAMSSSSTVAIYIILTALPITTGGLRAFWGIATQCTALWHGAMLSWEPRFGPFSASPPRTWRAT
jgi:hypothetical protein